MLPMSLISHPCASALRAALGRALAIASLGAALAAPASAQDTSQRPRIDHVDIYVSPYYEAGPNASAPAQVQVMPALDKLLASARRQDIEQARTVIQRDNASLTPMTLMVLAVRLYDVGLRDDAVFWFYAAKNRYIILESVLDLQHPQLAQVRQAMQAFITLAGPYINSYAFCDPARQQQQQQKSLVWTRENPYAALWRSDIPAKPGDRKENFEKALQGLQDVAREEAALLADPEAMAQFKQERQRRGVDQQFCW